MLKEIQGVWLPKKLKNAHKQWLLVGMGVFAQKEQS